MSSYTLIHYKVHYRVTEKLRPENNYTDYDDLCKELYHKCIANRGIEYYEILGVSTYSNGYETPLCSVAGTIYSGNREK